MYKSKKELFENLKPIYAFCKAFKFFIDKHKFLKKDILQDYINLFIFLYNKKMNNQTAY